MRKELISKIALAASDLSSSVKELLVYFNTSTEDGEIRFDVRKAIHGTELSFADCVSRILAIDEVVQKFDKSTNHLMVPQQRLTELKQVLDQTQQHLDALFSQFRQVVQNGGGQLVFNYENFHLQVRNGQQHDLRAQFKNFYDSTEALLEVYFRVLLILRPTKTTYSFQAAANSLSALIQSASSELQELHKANAALRQSTSEVEAIKAEAKASADESGRLKEESAKERKTIGEYLSDATDKKSSIDSVHSSASSLKDAVSEYKEKFRDYIPI